MLYINVPNEESKEVELLGAYWDQEREQWFIRSKRDYPKFQKWILGKDEGVCMVLCNHYYIVVADSNCPACERNTTLVSFGVENYYIFYEKGIFHKDPDPEYYRSKIRIASWLSPLSVDMQSSLKQRYNYYSSSGLTNSSYYGNHCAHCGVLIENVDIFNDNGSPFSVVNIETAKALTLYKVPLSEDIKASFDVGYGAEDYLIKKYGKREEWR